MGEKILLVPTYTVGQRLTDALARGGTAWIGIRAVTLDGLALEIAADRLAREDRSLLSRAQALAMIESACGDVIREGDYFFALKHSSGFFRAIRRSIDDLRSSGVRASSFPSGSFTNQRKAEEIRRVLARYEELLRQNRFVDRAELYDVALRGLPADPILETVYSAGLHDLHPVQREFLERLSRAHIPLQNPPDAGLVRGQGQAIRTARGTENEIRAIVREAIAESLPLDSIEIVHTNRDLYIPLILELTTELGVPATFEEGIPVPYTRPGQAILGYLEWLRLDWDATVLRKLISSAVIETGGLGPVLAARLFRNASVGWGRDRHLERMESLVREHERKLERTADDRDARNLARVREVRALVRNLVRYTPRDGRDVSIRQLARHATGFLNRYSRVASPRDAAAKEAILRVLAEIQTLPDRRETLSGAAVRLDELVREISVSSEAPRPGAVHVASLESGGWGGRDCLYVVGLDERFPGGGLQDPVLLDEERMIINRKSAGATLLLSGSRAERALREIRLLLDRAVTNRTTFLFSSQDLLDGRETLPSPFLLELWRAIHERADASYDDMLKELTPRSIGFVTADPATASEAWMHAIQRLTSERGLSKPERTALLKRMEATRPWLARGLEASRRRDGKEISEWSGKIHAAPEELDPRLNGKPISASRLETLAQSPYRYFLQNVLKIEPLQELERRPEEWLEAREFGGMFHNMLYEFMTAVIGRRETPAVAAHAEELRAVAERWLERMVKDVPPPSTAAFEVRRKELLEACELFLSEEEKWCRDAKPRWFEVPFGLSGGETSEIGSEDPVEIDLGSHGTLSIRGRIDRVDECGPNRFAIWDYKSGSSFKYSDQDYLAMGTQVQHALYAFAVRELLRRKGMEGKVVRSGYYFPTRKGRALRIERDPPFDGSNREAIETVLGGLLDAVRAGSFVHAIDKEDCKFCDYTSICGDVETVTKQTEAMTESSKDTGVAGFLRARGTK